MSLSLKVCATCVECTWRRRFAWDGFKGREAVAGEIIRNEVGEFKYFWKKYGRVNCVEEHREIYVYKQPPVGCSKKLEHGVALAQWRSKRSISP